MDRSSARVRTWLVLATFAPSAHLAAQVRPPSVPPVPSDTIVTEAATLTVQTVLEGLGQPVAMTFLPDGRAVLAERRPAALSVFQPDTPARQAVGGLPEIFDEGDAGLLDVAFHRAPTGGGWIYLAYTAAVGGEPIVVLDRARLVEHTLIDRERLFTAEGMLGDTTHFGGRIALAADHVFLTLGERYRMDRAQGLDSYNGTILRLGIDGSVPEDNPFVHDPRARPEIWSLGHRNPQGLAVHPGTGSLWAHEHGPQGGDEVNVVAPGRNYGWPVVTYGEEYGGGPIGSGRTHHPGMDEPIYYWTPSIGPSDLIFVSEHGIAGWRSSALVGALAGEHLARLSLVGDRVVHEERILAGRDWRIRMVEEAPDGSIWVGTDSGLLVRIVEVAR
jgi:aldose sugar dehydrogenase